MAQLDGYDFKDLVVLCYCGEEMERDCDGECQWWECPKCGSDRAIEIYLPSEEETELPYENKESEQ